MSQQLHLRARMDDKLKSYSGAVITSLPYLHECHVSGVDGVLIYAGKLRTWNSGHPKQRHLFGSILV